MKTQTKPFILALALMALLLNLFLSPALAADTPASLQWEALAPEVQQMLKPFAGRWDSFEPKKQQRLVTGARRWMKMTPEQRQEAKQKLQRWRKMKPEQRQRIRERMQKFRSLPPEDQERLRQARNRFKNLPQERKEELRDKWRNLSADEKKNFCSIWKNAAHSDNSVSVIAGNFWHRIGANKKTRRRRFPPVFSPTMQMQASGVSRMAVSTWSAPTLCRWTPSLNLSDRAP
jgi:hypothetical protein